jgi:hypothetical protein
MNHDELRELLKAAFRDVTLDGGISIRQGEICDNYGEDNDGREISEAEFATIPRGEIIGDWIALPLDELEQYPYLAYLDAKGFRYYIPAFLLSLLQDSQRGSMRVICTLSSLCPTRERWLYHMQQYELLSDEQRSAIAVFLFELKDYPRLDSDDQQLISGALSAYWNQYLPRKYESNVA